MAGWIAAAGAIGSALIGSQANRSAGASAAASGAEAIAEQRRQFDLTAGWQAPYRQIGERNLRQLDREVSRMPTAAEVMRSPGYQFGLNQGMLALDRQASAAGGRISGPSMKAASRYATDYATSGYNAEYQRRQDRWNRLAALAGIGQTATQASAAAGANSANAISGILQNQGATNAAARLARGNIWANTGNQLAALYMRGQQPQGASFGPGLDGFYGGAGTSGD